MTPILQPAQRRSVDQPLPLSNSLASPAPQETAAAPSAPAASDSYMQARPMPSPAAAQASPELGVFLREQRSRARSGKSPQGIDEPHSTRPSEGEAGTPEVTGAGPSTPLPAAGTREIMGPYLSPLTAWPLGIRHGVIDDKSVILPLVQQAGENLRCASARLQADPEVVRAAVQSRGTAIEYASPELKKDKALALEAIRDDAKAYLLLDPKLLADPDVQLEALRLAQPRSAVAWVALAHLPEALREDPAFHLKMLRQNAWSVEDLPPKLLQDPGFLTDAAMDFPPLLDSAPLRESRDQLLAGNPQLRQRYESVTQELRQLGIEDGMRLRSADLLDKVLRNRLEPRGADARPIATVVFCKEDTDHNGAMLRHNLDELSRHYRVMYYEARTDRELVDALKDAGRDGAASLVVLGGHGTWNGINLGSVEGRIDGEKALDLEDERLLWNAGLDSAIRPDAKVVLLSCSTGKGRDSENNMANMLAGVLPGREVYAPIEPTMDQLKFDESGRFVDPSYTRGPEETYRVRLPATKEPV
jgi:uncharacterized protein DUF4116